MPRRGISPPIASRVAPCGAAPLPFSAESFRAGASQICAKASPPRWELCGSITASAAPIATAASAALPPARRISTPISEASGFADATMPVRAVRSGVRVMLLMLVLPPSLADIVRH